jgi:hypothetical protein
MEKYRVTLTPDERHALEKLVSVGRAAARKLTHARMLLLADTSHEVEYRDDQIVLALGTSIRSVERVRKRFVTEGIDDTAACDIGAVEFFPLVNAFVTLDSDPETAFDPTPRPEAPAATFTITATFTNTSDTPLRFPFFTVTELSGDNRLLNADEGIMGVGATLTPDVGDRILALGEMVVVDFVLGLHTPERFTFVVDLFGEPWR